VCCHSPPWTSQNPSSRGRSQNIQWSQCPDTQGHSQEMRIKESATTNVTPRLDQHVAMILHILSSTVDAREQVDMTPRGLGRWIWMKPTHAPHGCSSQPVTHWQCRWCGW
jgi:hypothetical protein